MSSLIKNEIREYVNEKVLPLYDDNAAGHGRSHIETVMERSLELASTFQLDVDLNMVYVIAAFHDIGYKEDPENHEEVSARMFKEDERMHEFFSPEQIEIMAEAITDHRASLEYEARSIYGKLVSSADREVSVYNMLRRSILFQAEKHKDESPSLLQVIDYSYKKLASKYGKGGYAKMYYPDDKYKNFLGTMQKILADKDKFVEREFAVVEKMGKEDKDKLKVLIKS